MAVDICPASGLERQVCLTTICDCFYEQFPDDPYSLHPELYTVVIPEQEKRND